MRPSKNEYYVSIAKAVSERSTCLRAQCGVVIVNNDTIVSTGYSGSARGEINCCDVGICERDRLKIPPGEKYELCKSVHGEANAIINAARSGNTIIGSTMYIYFKRLDSQQHKHGGPCLMCDRMIKNAGIVDWVLEEIV